MTGRWARVATALLWLAVLTGARPAGWDLVDAVVAIVDKEVVTVSDLEAETLLLEREGLTAGSLPELLSDVIRRRLLAAEAEKLRLTPPWSQAVAAREAADLEPGADRFWEAIGALGVTREGVERRYLNVLAARRYEALKKETTFISEATVKEYYFAHFDQYPDQPLSEARGPIRRKLLEEKHREALAAWVDRQYALGRVKLLRSPETE